MVTKTSLSHRFFCSLDPYHNLQIFFGTLRLLNKTEDKLIVRIDGTPGTMSVRKTVFWGGQTIFWTGKKVISTLFILKFLFKLAILYQKIHKCQIPGPGKCLVLPIGADAHVRDPFTATQFAAAPGLEITGFDCVIRCTCDARIVSC